MSCGCNNDFGIALPANPCVECPPSTPDNESLPSALDNFIYHFFGALTKTQDPDTGKIIWTLPCDLTTGIVGNPRIAGEGLACYFKRLIADGVIGLSGKNGYAHTTADFVQPAVGSTVIAAVDMTDPFAVGQFIWGAVGGFYQVTAIGTLAITIKNLVAAPANLGPGGTVPSGTAIFQSGPAALPGPTGPAGTNGTNGASAYVYVAFARDASGSGFTLTTDDPTSRYLAIRVSTTVIPSPSAPDFAGRWVKFQNDQVRLLKFATPGTHSWVCPIGAGKLRVRVYGAGGGGGGGAAVAHGSANGFAGGGGEYADGIVAVTPGNVYSILIGAGGAAGSNAGDSTALGAAGADSKFFDGVQVYLLAKAGAGGDAGANLSGNVGLGGTNGGSGGVTTATYRYSGLDGASGTTDLTLGGHCGRLGCGGLRDGNGENPGGGGGGATGGGAGAAGGAGGNGMVEIEIVA